MTERTFERWTYQGAHGRRAVYVEVLTETTARITARVVNRYGEYGYNGQVEILVVTPEDVKTRTPRVLCRHHAELCEVDHYEPIEEPEPYEPTEAELRSEYEAELAAERFYEEGPAYIGGFGGDPYEEF